MPIVGLATARAYSSLLLALGAFVFSVYMIYRVSIGKVKPKYPIVSPEGHPDVYTGAVPRPIYEDMQRYPWFFKRK